MKLNDVLTELAPVVGLTSMMSAPYSVRTDRIDSDRITLGGAYEALENFKDLQNNAKSDAAHWGYEGQRAYWQAVVYLFEAAKITGPDDLPDIALPDLSDKVVMDAAYYMEQFGKEVLEVARKFGAADGGRTT
jgi:hypothetical protein